MTTDNAENFFQNLPLTEEVQTALMNLGYETPTEIQAQTIPLICEGRDLIGQAATGTGKTAAFATPLLSKIDPKLTKVQVLVLTPTRELAKQVADAFEKYGAGIGKLNIATIYGGQSYEVQNRALKRGAQIVVGTPGRIMDHMRRGTLKLQSMKAFVLDEADEMLRMGFADDVRWVLSEAPKERQTLLFSATLPDNVMEISKEHLNNPEFISVKGKSRTAATIYQRVCIAHGHEKLDVLVRILESEPSDGVLIFVKTRESSMIVAEKLCQLGYSASSLNGDMPQRQREKTVERLMRGHVDIVVATDVAARGLDVDRISHVVNYDFPHDTEAYIHRIGRTGRAGRTGNAILFVGRKDKRKLNRLERETKQEINWMDRPTQKAVHEQRLNQFHKLLTESLEAGGYDFWQKVLAGYQADTEIPLEHIAAALFRMTHPDLLPPSKKEERRERKEGRDNAFDDDKGKSKRDRKSRRANDRNMTKYRLEVGRTHGVKPGNIVGAIANEAGLEGQDIGEIQISRNFSSVDLPKGLSDDIISRLKSVRVAGRLLNISPWSKRGSSSGEGERKKDFRRGGKPKMKSNADRKRKNKKKKDNAKGKSKKIRKIKIQAK